jgi:hypothetical protein
VDFPIKNGGSFHSYVKLPEGKYWTQKKTTEIFKDRALRAWAGCIASASRRSSQEMGSTPTIQKASLGQSLGCFFQLKIKKRVYIRHKIS